MKHREGVMLDTKKFSSLHIALHRALEIFKTRPDLLGLKPEEVFFAPGEAPNGQAQIMGLNVDTDDRVDPGFIRVTTCPMTELEREKAGFAYEVDVAAAELAA